MNPDLITKEEYYQNLDSYYSILEKTNQQLSLWYNPYGLIIGILTLLFAVGAIIVSIMLVRNSREQKEIQKAFFDEQKLIIKEQQDKLNDRYESAKKDIDVLIGEYEKKLKSVGDKGGKQIEAVINDLKKQKAALGLDSNFQQISYFDESPVYSFNKKSIVCSQCGKTFNYYDDRSDPLGINTVRLIDFGRSKKIHCSHCGAVNIPS